MSAAPLLLHDLRVALACLYSLTPGAASNMDAHSAHEFLMHLQSRNVRRKIQSMRQRDRDQEKNRREGISLPADSDDVDSLSEELTGSTWLACLALLCQSDAHSTERLFAAQTLMHRLRRTKLSEAIDVDMEDPSNMLSSTANFNLAQTLSQYGQWIHSFHPLLGCLVQNFHIDWNATTNEDDEDRLKGELSMLTLSAVAYLVACSTTSTSDQNTHPLLFTLGSTLAALALRLRYTPRSIANNVDGVASSTPIVTMVAHSLSTVAEMAASMYPDISNEERGHQQRALYGCLCICIAAIPDTILGSPGGARGRLSVDPRCVQAAHEELRNPTTGLQLLWEALQAMPADDENIHGNFLTACERWAKFLPLPMDFVQHTMPLTLRYLTKDSSTQKSSLAYLIAIYEGSSWTVDQILSFSLGLSSDQLIQQSAKKKQSSKSKKRQKELLETSVTDTLQSQAEAECYHRGESAVQATKLVWEGVEIVAKAALSNVGTLMEGEGPIGCLCSCANACLPHLTRHPTTDTKSLVMAILPVFQAVCSHKERTVRALAYEPICTLHDALVTSARSRGPSKHVTELESIVADHLFQCSMRLATSCGYPTDYFSHMGEDNDEELEIERNDVRDVLRTVSGSEGSSFHGDSDASDASVDISSLILDRIVRACTEAASVHCGPKALPPETAVHALSALAKPLNQIGLNYARGFQPVESLTTLRVAIYGLGVVCQTLVTGFPELSVADALPVSRLACLATASFAPALSAMCTRTDTVKFEANDQPQAIDFHQTLATLVHAAAMSIFHLPELIAESTLDHARYDIRGAMRGPGGDDHVGCLALMRLAFESDELGRAMTTLEDGSSSKLLMELCKLHNYLKLTETERGPRVVHGKGVTPKSRRILLKTISRLVFLKAGADVPDDKCEASLALSELFNGAISSIATINASAPTMDSEIIFRTCENVFDLASFSPVMVSQLFAEIGNHQLEAVRVNCIKVMVDAGRYGYSRLSFDHQPDAAIIQWGRLRAGLLALLRTAACPDLPRHAADAAIEWNKAECEAIGVQCAAGPSSASTLFCDAIISDSHVPSGIFVRVLGEALDGVKHTPDSRGFSMTNCLRALSEMRTIVLRTILLECPEPSNHSLVDPRPTLCEAWFSAMRSLITSLESCGTLPEDAYNNATIRSLLSESACAAMLLLLYASLGKGQDNRLCDCGMSLDGPHTRAIMEFVEKYFLLGPAMLHSVASAVRSQLNVSFHDELKLDNDSTSAGVAIVGGALFRAASGGLPPWAIEGIPAVYAALYRACGSDPTVFGQMLTLSMEVRLSSTSLPFGGLQPGKLVAGRYFESMKATAKHSFVEKSMEACSKDNAEGWRRFKVLLKQTCGGKKKGAGFNLKPSFTNWECDRL